MLHWLERKIDKIIIKNNKNANVFYEIKYSLSAGISFIFIESFIYFILLLLYSQIPYIIFNHNIYCTHTLYVIIKIIIEKNKYKCTFVNKSNGIKYSINIKYRDLSWKIVQNNTHNNIICYAADIQMLLVFVVANVVVTSDTCLFPYRLYTFNTQK